MALIKIRQASLATFGKSKDTLLYGSNSNKRRLTDYTYFNNMGPVLFVNGSDIIEFY